jgi:Na+-driven multidrug efflux pump
MTTFMKMDKIKKFFDPQDMTIGAPMTGIVRFSIPLLIGNFAQQLYSTVDSIVVGKYVGDGALAAVGASFPVLNLLLVLFMGISTGATIMVSQYFGAKDRHNLSHTIGTCVVLTFLASLFMMVLGYFSSGPIMGSLNTPLDIRDMSIEYLKIIFIGILGGTFFNILSGILRGMGDSVYPLIFLLIASILNIFLDILFVTRFQLGVAGVAWVTRSDNYPKGSPDSIFASLLITWVVGFLITVMVYRQNGWKKKAITTYKKNLAPKVCLHE